jgi:hypothetical protein
MKARAATGSVNARRDSRHQPNTSLDFVISGCDDPPLQPGEGQMAKSTRNTGNPWTVAEVKQLRQEAKGNMPTRVMGVKHGRTEAAIRGKAQAEGISLKPTNQSPYGTKKKT